MLSLMISIDGSVIEWLRENLGWGLAPIYIAQIGVVLFWVGRIPTCANPKWGLWGFLGFMRGVYWYIRTNVSILFT